MSMINKAELENEVKLCLDAADGDCIRALEFACANLLVSRRSASFGITRRGQMPVVSIDEVPRLNWQLPENEEE